MLKRLIKYICHKVYSIGKFEDLRLRSIERNATLNKAASIHETAFISEEAQIYNQQGDSSKIRIGMHSRIMGDIFTFSHGGEISIGDYCFLGPQSRIWSAKKIIIGNRVLIAHNVNIHDNVSHPMDSKERHEEFVLFAQKGSNQKADLRGKEIIIEDDVWIGFNCVILKGVRIGKGAIIGANTIVTKDVPPYAVIVGNSDVKIVKYST